MNDKYDIPKRTLSFGKDCVALCKRLEHDIIIRPILEQLVKSSTSVGANYCEADNAESPRDFIHKIGICKKESKEANFFLNILVGINTNNKINEEIELLADEARQLNLIFNRIYISTKRKQVRKN